MLAQLDDTTRQQAATLAATAPGLATDVDQNVLQMIQGESLPASTEPPHPRCPVVPTMLPLTRWGLRSG